MTEHPPAVVLALAASLPQLGPLPPRPTAWREYPDRWVICLEDGRKLTFTKEPAPAQAVNPAPTKKKKGQRK